MSLYPPHASGADRLLFDRARQIEGTVPTWRDVSQDELRGMAERHGVQVATAWWCDAIRNSKEQQGFIQGADTPAVVERIANPPTIVVVRGAFYGEHSHTGADGKRIVRIADEIGWPVEMPLIRSFGSLETNASIIVEHLLNTRASRVVLVSLSKGSADIAMALRDPRADAAFARVCGWVSLSGITLGTPLVQWLRAHRLRTMGVHMLLWCRGQRFAVIDQLRHGEGPLARQVSVPSHICPIHVVGFPTRTHLRHPWASRAYERIAPQGPTDGGGILLADVARLPGLVYPVWGADHYLQPGWDVVPLIRKLLLHAARSDSQASTIPTSKSTA